MKLMTALFVLAALVLPRIYKGGGRFAGAAVK